MGGLSVSLVSCAGTEEATLKTKTVVMNNQTVGLKPLTDQELVSIEGGAIPSWLKKLGWYGVFNEINRHWDDIKGGFIDGWNFPNKKS
jgi:hypothetical protein